MFLHGGESSGCAGFMGPGRRGRFSRYIAVRRRGGPRPRRRIVAAMVVLAACVIVAVILWNHRAADEDRCRQPGHVCVPEGEERLDSRSAPLRLHLPATRFVPS